MVKVYFYPFPIMGKGFLKGLDAMAEEERREMVNHPQHYNQGMIEVMDVIDGLELGFLEGTIIKYVARYGLKSQEHNIEDLNKAKWYLKRLIAQSQRPPLTDEEKTLMRRHITNLLLKGPLTS